MNRLTIVLAAAGLISIANSAQASVLLYGWNGSDEGWTNTNGEIIGTSPARGITEGTGALNVRGNVNDKGGSGYNVVSPMETGGILQQLAGRTELVVDVVMVAETGSGSDWQNFNFSLTLAGTDANGTNFSTSAAFSERVGGHSDSRINRTQGTYTYDYSTIAGGSLTAGTAQSVQFRFNLSTAGGDYLYNFPEANNVAIDNFRVVPEPASFATIGLGGLMLMARRRRSA